MGTGDALFSLSELDQHALHEGNSRAAKLTCIDAPSRRSHRVAGKVFQNASAPTYVSACIQLEKRDVCRPMEDDVDISKGRKRHDKVLGRTWRGAESFQGEMKQAVLYEGRAANPD